MIHLAFFENVEAGAANYKGRIPVEAPFFVQVESHCHSSDAYERTDSFPLIATYSTLSSNTRFHVLFAKDKN